MTENLVITSIVPRVVLAIFCLCFTCVAAKAYRSEQLFTGAEAGPKTISDYRYMLERSYTTNKFNGAAALRYAQFLQSRGEFGLSRKVLLDSGMRRARWQAWELEGNAWDWLTFTPQGTMRHGERAADFYDKTLRVHPSYEKGLERRTVLAIKIGDWSAAEHLATRLLALNAANTNVTYFRGRMAEGRGDLQRAYDAYGKLSAAGLTGIDALFTRREIVDRLTALQDRIGQ